MSAELYEIRRCGQVFFLGSPFAFGPKPSFWREQDVRVALQAVSQDDAELDRLRRWMDGQCFTLSLGRSDTCTLTETVAAAVGNGRIAVRGISESRFEMKVASLGGELARVEKAMAAKAAAVARDTGRAPPSLPLPAARRPMQAGRPIGAPQPVAPAAPVAARTSATLATTESTASVPAPPMSSFALEYELTEAVGMMSNAERIILMLEVTLDHMPKALGSELASAVAEEAIGVGVEKALKTEVVKRAAAKLARKKAAIKIGTVLAAWAGSHAFGVGFIIDALLLVVVGISALMNIKSLYDGGEAIYDATKAAKAARREAEILAAGKKMADGISKVGVTSFMIVVSTWRKGRDTSVGEADNAAAATAAKKAEPKDSPVQGGETSPVVASQSAPAAEAATNSASPVKLKPKAKGVKEEGAVPMDSAIKREVLAGKSIEKALEDGKRPMPNLPSYPIMQPQDVASFRMYDPVEIHGPAKLYRVVGEGSNLNGAYWSREPPPGTEAAWRSSSAVTNDFSGDGGYVVHEIKAGESIKAWEGPIRAQRSADPDFALKGGGIQLFLGSGNTNAGPIQATPWNK